MPVNASGYLFTNGGAGTVGITVGNLVNANLAVNNDSVTMPNNIDMAIAFASGDKLTMSSGTIVGAVDFADPATTSTGGTCSAMPGSVCKVDSGSSITSGTISGFTLQNASPIGSAVNEWLGLTSTSTGWGAVTTTTNPSQVVAVNLASGATLCAGVSGCSVGNTANSTVTKIINGVSQTAYVFDITSSGSHINSPVTIKGDGSTLVILNYSGTNTLQSNQVISLSGLSPDQVLLNNSSTGGMQTSNGFSFTGALAISRGTTINLDGAGINGRLFISGASSPSIQSGFNLTAPSDIGPNGVPAPESESTILMASGLALVLIASAARRHRRLLGISPSGTSTSATL